MANCRKALAVDAGTFIKRGSFRYFNVDTDIFTVSEVIAEIRDEATRNQLNSLPIKITIKVPSEEARKRVIHFARKTGDIRVLSKTDLELMALAVTLEIESNGTKYIREEPKSVSKPTHPPSKKKGNGAAAIKQQVDQDSSPADTNTSSAAVNADETQQLHPKTESEKDPIKQERLREKRRRQRMRRAEKKKAEQAEGVQKSENPASINVSQTNKDTQEIYKDKEKEGKGEHGNKDINSSSDQDKKSSAGIKEEPLKREESPQENQGSVGKLMDKPISNSNINNDGGWINEENISKLQPDQFAVIDEPRSNNSEEERKFVACMTTDFAMQNVLIQMGIQLVSMDGILLRKVKRWILKCHACFKPTDNIEAIFCPSCGLQTLRRVSVRVDTKGNVTQIEGWKHLSKRGTKYSIPKPKMGKSNQKIKVVHTEDELMQAQHSQGKSSRKTRDDGDWEGIDADYFFQKEHVARSGPEIVIGGGKKSRNVSRKQGKRR